MQLTLEEAKKRFPDRLPPAPLQYAGRWVAWNKEHAKIVAHGINYSQVHAEAIAAGCQEPLMQRVLGAMFVGRA